MFNDLNNANGIMLGTIGMSMMFISSISNIEVFMAIVSLVSLLVSFVCRSMGNIIISVIEHIVQPVDSLLNMFLSDIVCANSNIQI